MSDDRVEPRAAWLSERRGFLTGLATLAAPTIATAVPAITVQRQRLVQGGHIVLRIEPRASLIVDGVGVGKASAKGLAVVGFDRDAPSSVRVEIRSEGGRTSAI